MRKKPDRRLRLSPSRGSKSNSRVNKTPSTKSLVRYVDEDEDIDSRRESIASLLAEDGDNASTSSNLSEGFEDGICDKMCCGQADDVVDEERELNELREMRKEIDEMIRTMDPSSVPDAESMAIPPPPPQSSPNHRSPKVQQMQSSPTSSPKVQYKQPSPKAQQKSMQIDMKRHDPRQGKLSKQPENDLVKVGISEKYDEGHGKCCYQQPEDDQDSDIWANFFQCPNFCITWSNFDKTKEMDTVSDITTPKEALPWNDDFQHGKNESAPTRPAKLRYKRSNSRSRPGYTSSLVISPTIGTAPSYATQTITSNLTSPSFSKLQRLPKSPLRKSGKVKARKVKDEDGTVLFEV